MCEEQHMHNERVWNIKYGLVHHSFAAGLRFISHHSFTAGLRFISHHSFAAVLLLDEL